MDEEELFDDFDGAGETGPPRRLPATLRNEMVALNDQKNAQQRAREKVEVVLPEAAKDAMDVMMTAMREGEDSVDKIMFESAKFILNKVLPTAAPERAVVEEVIEVNTKVLSIDEVEELLKKKMKREEGEK